MPTSNRIRRICLILGTGRCGSTALSGILGDHPDVLSVSELFATFRGRDLTERDMDGAEFWRLVSTPLRADSVLHGWKTVPEVLYPLFSPRDGASRFAWPAALPPLAGATLPHLTDRPDDLYARLEQAMPDLPRRLLSDHLWWLFDVLAGDRRPSVVVERSGGSLGSAAALLRLFPDAQVVHIYRDGRECALSMSRHPRFKFTAIQAELAAVLGYNPYGEDGQTGWTSGRKGNPAVPGALAALTPGRISPEAFEGFEVPLTKYGLMWSAMVAAGIPALPLGSRLHALDYQDLVDRPRESIGALFDFLEVVRDPVREADQAAAIRAGRDARAGLSEQQWLELTNVCRMGMNRLYGRGRWM
jgi:hypothetical protein